MKLKHRLFAASLALTMILSLCACGAKEKSLREQGLEVVALMEEMVNSEAYIQYHTGAKSLQEIVASIAEGDYSEPTAIYSIKTPRDLPKGWEESLPGFTDFSEPLQKTILQKTFGSAMMLQVNALSGAETLAATSVCTAGKTFVCKGAEGDVTYLYVYETGYPVAVTFTEGESNSFSASGTFLLNETFDASSQESVAAFFSEYGVEVGTVPLS